MTQLGVARTLPWRRESTNLLGRELTVLLTDRRYRDAALAVQARLNSEDGLNESIRAVELVLRG
jgi:UDP:flavonoid glycosyltransferase YjiC (YdhE family)